MRDRGVLVERRKGGFHVGGVPPTPRTPLVGRDDELARIRAALATSRMVTLTGPGGAGKTRLALAAVSDIPAPAGVAWVELAEVADAKLVAEMVRSVLGVPGTSGTTPTQAIVDRVRDAEVVVALDNCEHVAGAAAAVVDQLLDGCPRLRMVTTSREPLAVEGELIWAVAPLAAPGADVTTAEAVRASPAGRLFEVRAQAVLPSFRITDTNAAAIARLCRRLDGLPLAIELAAARVRVLSVEQIVAGLDDVFRLLAGGTRTGPLRHQSLRATLDWGHELLSEPERIVFRRLGVFPGSFDLAAAEAVVGTDVVAPGGLLDLLARLVDRSLVTPRPAGERMRYRLLAPIRSYARERLAAAGERSMAGAAHLDHYADVVESSEPLLSGAQQAAELDRLETEGNNLRVALAFAADRRPPPVAGLRLAAGLSRLCALRGHYREGRHWLDWAATVPADVPPELRAKALLGSGSLAHLQCDYPAAVRRLEAARAGYAELDDRAGVAASLQALGSVARERGRYARAEALHREVLQLAEESGDERRIAQCHGYLGFAAWLQEQWEEAEIECRRALSLFRRLGDGEGIVWSLLSLGIVAQYRGELETAGDLLDRAHRMSCELSYREGIAWALHERGLLAMRRGDPAAADLLRNALVAQCALGDRWRTASVLLDLAAYAQRRSEDARAVALLGAAAAVRTEIGTEIAPCERADHDRVEWAARDRLSAEDFARAWAHGQTAVLDDLLAESPEPPEPPARPVVLPSTPPTKTPTQLRIRAFGEANVYCGDRMLTPSDWGYAKPRELLFLLVGGAPQTKSEIGRALWPDIDGVQLRNAFHTALRDLRRALGDPAWVTFSAGRYAINRSREHWCDLEIFEEALAAARQARPAEAALPHLQRAIGAYAGEFGAGLPDAEWLQPRRADLSRSFTRALSTAGRLLAADGRAGEAADLFRRAVDHDPLDEAAHRQLMAALVRTGEAAQAARVYQQLADRLHAELGISPAAETRAVYQRLERAR